jgi:transposase
MIGISEKTAIFIAIKSIDFRCGIGKIAAIASEVFEGEDPSSGSLFIFRNRAKTAIKALYYDRTGFWLLHKRLSRGKLSYWPRTEYDRCQISFDDLKVLFAGRDPRLIFNPEWKSAGEGYTGQRESYL